ncbi:MAG: hypothetical protein LBT62_06775, partial [Deltaproteobacteria bacterium]|nr:hypothetical protein [Deltaproteobacteria bacterium]
MTKKIKLTDEELKRAFDLVYNSTEIRDYRRGIIGAILSDNRYTADELATLLGITERTVFNELAKIRNPDFQSTN